MRSLFFLVCLLVASGVLAEPDAQTEQLARERFSAGRDAYQQGHYQDAYTEFQLSYDLSQRPALLYNLGLAAQKLGKAREALDAFEGYLAWGKGERSEEVRGRVATLRDVVAHEPQPEPIPRAAVLEKRESPVAAPAVARAAEPGPVPPAPPPVRQDAPRSGARAWWIAAGVVLAAAAIAVGIAVPLSKRDGKPGNVPNTGLTVDALRWAP